MINFPTSPALNDTHTEAGKTWKWNGTGWALQKGEILPGDVPDLDASKITTGILPAVRGGTGIGTYTSGNYIAANSTTTLAQRTPAQVLTDIAAAPLASPALTGTPTAPTAAVGTNTTQLATTAFVNAEIANDAPTKTGGGASGTWGISISGNAATATTATDATNATTALALSNFESTASTNVGLDSAKSQISYVQGTTGILGQSDGALYSHVYSSSWKHQIYADYRSGQIAIRGKNSGTWQPWRTVWDSGNFDPSGKAGVDGAGASGTWSISISGNAATVSNGVYTTGSYANPSWITSLDYSKLTGTVPTWNQNTTGSAATLTTSRSISMTGDVAWSVSFNGSANVTAAGTLATVVTAGTATKITYDAKGRVTAGASLAAADIPSLDWSKITTGKPTTLAGYGITDAVNTSLLGAANGVATLDSSGLIPTGQLPSYVDDVLEYANLAGFPVTGVTGKIYVAQDTGKIYRWSGSVYIEISPTAGNADSATQLATARLINGTSFNGTADITTANWGTARTITIGDTGKSVNGSSSVSWTLNEIGAAADDHNHTLDSLSNVTITSNSNGEILRWNGTAWVNNTLAEAGIQPAGSYLTGNQTITLSGDVTGSGATSIAATIASNAVTLAKMADVATGTVFYRKTAGTGDPEVQTLATLKTDLGLTGTNSGDQTITLTGDVTGSGTGSFAATIANNSVTLEKMADIASSSILGRVTALSGDPEVLTAAQVRTLLNVADGATANTGTVTSVSGGNGLTGSVTTSGSLALGTPSDVTLASTNSVTASSHTHAFNPGGTTAQYIRGDGSLATLPSFSGTGTVTSVAASGSTGLTVGGSPITTSGTLTFTLSSNLQSWSGIAPSSKADSTHNHTLDSLSNVTITSNSNGEILRWNGTAWVNNTLAEAGIQPAGSYAAASHNQAWSTITSTPTTLSGYGITDAASNTISISAGNGLTGGGTLAATRTLTLGTPSTITGATTNSVTTSSHTHALTLASGDITGALGFTPYDATNPSGYTTNTGTVTSVSGGNGLTGSVTTSGSLALGTPSDITLASTNSVTGSSHTHAFAPGGTTAQYIRGDGSLATFPSVGSGTVTSVAAGNGMNFTTITGSGSVTLGTPSTLTPSTTNALTSNSHTHQITGFAPTTTPTFLGPVKIDGSFGGGSTEAAFYAGDWAQLASDGTGRALFGRNMTTTRADNTLRVATSHGSLGFAAITLKTNHTCTLVHFQGSVTAGDPITSYAFTEHEFLTDEWLTFNNTWSGAQTFSGALVVTTGGYLRNRRDIPRLYLESPNTTNGYYLDANVSNAVFGDLTIRRTDNYSELFRLTNTGNATFAGDVSDAAGSLSDIPQNLQNANYTFALTDRRKHVLKNNTTAYAWTIPLNSTTAFPIGTAILVINDGTAGNITITRTSGVALLDGSTDANFILLPGQSRTLLKVGTDRWRVL